MKQHTYDETFQASKEYFKGDELAAKVFVDKYALQDSKGNFLEKTPSDMHHRLAKEFARIESKYPNPMSESEIFDLLDGFKYVVPQGSPMFGIGNPYQVVSLSNCYVLESPYDSYAGILKTDQEQAHVYRRRGGIGFDISNIRPKGLDINNAAKTTDGIGLFMERFSTTCREVAQGGRRGALLLSISCHHPEIRTFINIKKNLQKVTGANISVRLTDEFMQAVKNKEKVQLRWPVDSKDPKISSYEDAEVLWSELCDAAHASAEPGLLFWDNALNYTPAQVYKDQGFNHTSTNPCFSADTKIAVADGRHAVRIEDLAKEGKDVPVYSVDKRGKVSIKMGRHPRVTGYNQKLVRVHLDDGSYVDTTPNHKFLTLDGQQIEAKDLKSGTSLPRFLKEKTPLRKDGSDYIQLHCDTQDMSNERILEHRLIAKFHQPEKWDQVYDAQKQNGWTKGGLVIHHKDYNPLNNAPDNLEIMSFKDHQAYHAEHDNKGENNGHFSGITNEQLREHALTLTKQLGRRFSNEDWISYAGKHNLPQSFSQFRKEALGNTVKLAHWAALELGLEYVNSDPRLVKTLQQALDQNYQARIVGNEVFVKKTCEHCVSEFEVDYWHREVAYCSNLCGLAKRNSNPEFHAARTGKTVATCQARSVELKQKQAAIFSQLKFDLKREPMLKEWEQACKKQELSFRLKTKFGFKNWDEVKEAGSNYNHKVVKVEELLGEHTVYNITVDDNHTVGIVTDDNQKWNGIFLFNCGEIILSPNDSCRLLLVNLSNFVTNSFQPDASFDFEKFADVVGKAQRLMDDLIDLELECIDRILAKVDADPEPAEVKVIEKNLWLKIKKACIDGRRTGLGITALGDCLAYLGIRYGSEESIEMTEKIYKALAINSYKSSCLMAQERGAFPIFNKDLERDHPFLQRIWDAAPEVFELYQKYGRRNIANTTTAPAGSVSTLTQTTSGIEPVYMLAYTRRKKINPDSKNVKVDFVDPVGDSWQEYKVYHHGVKKWMQMTGQEDAEQSPYYLATAMDCDWQAGVRLQAAAQKWICHSISRTANVPNSASVQLIKDIYMMAWEQGCKGYTVYRDGCRTGVLVSEETYAKQKKVDPAGRPLAITPVMAPKRPKELTCDIHHVTVKGVKWTALVGLLFGEPYELFMGKSEDLPIAHKHKTGKIVKASRGRYHLYLEDEAEPLIENIVKTLDDNEIAWATRMISTSLRHGISVEYLVEQLSKEGSVVDVNNVLARTLKKYIKEEMHKKDQCPQCGKSELIYEEKCKRCLNSECGWSGCG